MIQQIQKTITVPLMLDGEPVTIAKTIVIAGSIEVVDGVAIQGADIEREIDIPQYEELEVVDVDGNPVYE
jgi:hypothetical protein|tara:strand:- start:40 stop:249 length:210 start_codon:yes stop_codon:yes gene_type:complete